MVVRAKMDPSQNQKHWSCTCHVGIWSNSRKAASENLVSVPRKCPDDRIRDLTTAPASTGQRKWFEAARHQNVLQCHAMRSSSRRPEQHMCCSTWLQSTRADRCISCYIKGFTQHRALARQSEKLHLDLPPTMHVQKPSFRA